MVTRLLAALATVVPVSLAAETITIEHQPIGCVVAEQFPIIPAQLTPAEDVARARVFFKAEQGAHWYFVEMVRSEGAFAAVLPKPKPSAKAIHYYVETVATGFATDRSTEQAARVVSTALECRTGSVAATTAAASGVTVGVPAGAPAVPAGFSGAGVSTVAATATAGAVSAAAGSAAAGAAVATGAGLSTGVIVGGLAAVAAAGAAVAVTKGGSDGGNGGDEGSGRVNAEISGHVFASCLSNGNGTGPCTNTGPIAGAVVSTSLDAVTATTDGSGFFRLVAGTAVAGDACYTLTITAGGHPTYSVQGTWGNHNVDRIFVLSPPAPFVPGPPCTTH